MKIFTYKKSAVLLTGLALIFSSCDKNFETINDDPNNPRNVPNSYFLAGAERGIMDNSADVWWGANVGNQLAQYWSSNQYSSESRYQFRTAITNAYWGLFYSGGLNDPGDNVGGLLELNRIIENCTTDPGGSSASGYPANQIAAAKILRVWLIQNMTDAWGNIPYSQALNPDKYRAPEYDSQQSIYAGLLSEVSDAVSMIDEAQAGPGGDLIYSGDMSLWKKFGNSLKMRVGLRIADVSPTTAQSAFEAAAAAGGFTANSDNALFPYGEGVDANPIYFNRYIDNRNDYAASNILLDILNTSNDARLPCFFTQATATSTWVGEVYGLSEANAASTPNSSVSQRSALVLSPTMPGIYLDYAQVEFMLAEGAERGWNVGGGSAQSHYDAGVTASIDFWTTLNGTPADPADIATYLAQPSVDYTNAGSGATWQEKIGKQKWIALFNQGIQGWTEWRRLDFGILQLPADGVLSGSGIPTRMKYAVDEQTLNAAHYSAAIAAQGPDLQSTKVWWDVQ
ncbi:MAG: SusD/RagB family nutrient-binding outer membrane lipoprotein [Bacteroidetes bacterium]|nr:SusD/RagB family nutrient-binding outer membrane lipoprotein [Bacteroidota bacterium]